MPTTPKPAKTFTSAEKAAMRERAKELKAAEGRAEGEATVVAKIAEMPKPDRAIAERIHALIKAAAPQLASKTWYGMPAYTKDDKIICFFKPASKFGVRYATLGFNDAANLDDGNMWPSEYAVMKLTPAEEKRISALVKKAVS
jgi:hypothetical protein